MFGMVTIPYEDRERRRNRMTVLFVTFVAIVACGVGGLVTEWPWKNALGMMGVAVVFGAASWWLWGSRSAGRVRLSGPARQWFGSLGVGRGKRSRR